MNLAKRMECAVSRRFEFFYLRGFNSNENREKRRDTARSIRFAASTALFYLRCISCCLSSLRLPLSNTLFNKPKREQQLRQRALGDVIEARPAIQHQAFAEQRVKEDQERSHHHFAPHPIGEI